MAPFYMCSSEEIFPMAKPSERIQSHPTIRREHAKQHMNEAIHGRNELVGAG
jgi:hypothetical protein